MKEFSNKSKINKVWYNSLLIQLFPKEKSFYQMPGIQIAGVAASLLLVLNIFLTNDPINNENQVAVNNEPNTEEKSSSLELENENEYNITLVTGIANPTTLKNHLQKRGRKVNLIRFSDHHNYTLKDVKNILLIHNKEKSAKKLILTTEKDATKLRRFLPNFKQKIYYIGIDVVINEKQKFKKQLLDYVRAS